MNQNPVGSKPAVHWFLPLVLAGWLATPAAQAQVRPYIGYAYPAGGQQGTTFEVRLGGQGLDGVHAALVTGTGVTVKVVEYYRRINNQEEQLLIEQLKELKRATTAIASAMSPTMTAESPMMSTMTAETPPAGSGKSEQASNLIARIEKRTREFVQRPACASISALAILEVTMAPDAEPGEREIRLVTRRGVSNPLTFHVGQMPEFSRKPMITASLQVLGKEAQSLRKRPADEVEDRITVPCAVNGQIASGEVNRYRFAARQGQRLVITTLGRQLVPFIADAVPGWFQPVLLLYDANGNEVAFDDDYQFKPDPTIFYEIPQDGEYVFAIHDAIYRGREDFVYRITIGELPFITSIFPLGSRVGESVAVKMRGWNLEEATLTPPPKESGAGIQWINAYRKRFVSNRVPFAMDTLPECLEMSPNHNQAHAQKVTLPIIINGHLDKSEAWDVFQFVGKASDAVVIEVCARQLDSPLDSMIQLTDAKGTLLAANDDHESLTSGLNTHQADSYLLAKLPADGHYYVRLGDTAGKGGNEYAYRLRISAPQPDFALRVVPSSIGLRSKASATVNVYAIRKDGFAGPIKLSLKDTPTGFSSSAVTISGNQTMARFTFKTGLISTKEPVNLSIVGSAKIGDHEIAHEAVPAEDRMQAFLWRHLVPARDFKVLVFDPAFEPPPKRVPPAHPAPAVAPEVTNAMATTNVNLGTNATGVTNAMTGTNAALAAVTKKPKFTKQQITARLRQLRLLFEEGLLTDDFYDQKVAECDTAQ